MPGRTILWPTFGGVWQVWPWCQLKNKMNHREVVRFGKYMAGGSLYFWSGYAIFAICYSLLHWSWLPAKVAADAVGWSLNYLVQRFWAFGDQHHLSEMQHAS